MGRMSRKDQEDQEDQHGPDKGQGVVVSILSNSRYSGRTGVYYTDKTPSFLPAYTYDWTIALSFCSAVSRHDLTDLPTSTASHTHTHTYTAGLFFSDHPLTRPCPESLLEPAKLHMPAVVSCQLPVSASSP
jgi:hypothetical protein